MSKINYELLRLQKITSSIAIRRCKRMGWMLSIVDQEQMNHHFRSFAFVLVPKEKLLVRLSLGYTKETHIDFNVMRSKAFMWSYASFFFSFLCRPTHQNSYFVWQWSWEWKIRKYSFKRRMKVSRLNCYHLFSHL